MKRFNVITLLAFASITLGAFAFVNKVTLEARATTTTPVATELGGVKVIKGYNTATRYLLFNIKNSDYTFSYNGGNDFPVHYDAGQCVIDYQEVCNFQTNCLFNDQQLNISDRSVYLKYYGNSNCIGIEVTSEMTILNEGDTLFIPSGTTFPSYGLLSGANTNLFTTTKDATYRVVDGSFRKEIATTSTPTSISTLDIIPGYNTAQRFLIVSLSNNDYDDVTENNGNDFNVKNMASNSFQDCSNFGYTMELNGNRMNLEDKFIYLNYYAHYGSIGIEFTDIYSTLHDFDKVTIKSGTSFPSYEILKDNGNTVYVTDDDITYTYFDYHFHVCSKASDAKAVTTETEHWYKCAVCEQEILRSEHHFINDQKEATCTEDGFDNAEFCEDCGYIKTAGNVIPALGHDYEDATYLYDAEGHWQECKHECGETNEKVAHTYEDGSKVCSTCGYTKNVYFVNVVNGYTFNGLNEFTPNTEVTVIANTPEDGYKFYGWYIGDEPVASTSTYTFEITSDVVLEAKYTKDNKDYGEPDILGGDTGEQETKKGCGGSIIASSSILAITSTLALSFILKKKKED